MKNKLLVTTAISTVALAGLAHAETKVTGSLVWSYTATGHVTNQTSGDGFGRESQINVSNSGDLNNGMKYAAGFSLEFDGNNTGAKSNENIYIDFISGNTTLSVGLDHGLNTDTSAVPRVATPNNSHSGGNYRQGASIGNALYNMKEAAGVFVAQKFDGGTLQVRGVRRLSDTGGADTGITADNQEGGGYEAIFVGDLGVKGLAVNLQYANASKAVNSTLTPSDDSKAYLVSAAYNFGKVSVGAGRNKREAGNAAATANEFTTTEYGVTFAAADNLTLGVNVGKTEKEGSSNDEKFTQIQLGYNLGAVGIALGYSDTNDLSNASGSDTKVGYIRLSTAF